MLSFFLIDLHQRRHASDVMRLMSDVDLRCATCVVGEDYGSHPTTESKVHPIERTFRIYI